MEALYKINNTVTIKLEAPNIQGLIEQLTIVREGIGPEPCGKCGSKNTFPSHRKVDKYNYYELKCVDCGAILQLGTHQNEQKTLFKKIMEYDDKGNTVMKDGKGVYAKDGGWKKWNSEKKIME